MSKLLTAGVLRNLRRVVADLATDTCIIVTPGTVGTSSGGVANPTSTTQTVACHIAPASTSGHGEESTYADRLAGRTLWKITMPINGSTPTVATTSLVYSPDTNGRRFEVLGMANPRTHEAGVRIYAAEKNR